MQGDRGQNVCVVGGTLCYSTAHTQSGVGQQEDGVSQPRVAHAGHCRCYMARRHRGVKTRGRGRDADTTSKEASTKRRGFGLNLNSQLFEHLIIMNYYDATQLYLYVYNERVRYRSLNVFTEQNPLEMSCVHRTHSEPCTAGNC